ncbi:hypothetical protein [Flexithrix dorotheae]|uniref:hypothetical protein n=1 Tax=Flexithrix dorotheae TaxID=70993 RepID=UPI0003817769|nr:hypothetical protein [Flexithrix dorotheae]
MYFFVNFSSNDVVLFEISFSTKEEAEAFLQTIKINGYPINGHVNVSFGYYVVDFKEELVYESWIIGEDNPPVKIDSNHPLSNKSNFVRNLN